MTDKTRVTLSTSALAPYPRGFTKSRPSLHARCNGGELDVFFSSGSVMDDDEIEYRFDSGEPESLSGIRSSDYQALFVSQFNELDPAAFLRKMIASSRLRIRWTPYGESPAVVNFSMNGLGALAPRLRSAGCDYRAEAATVTVENLSGAAKGFVAPPANAEWVGDLTVKTAYPLACSNGKSFVDFARARNFSVVYFADEAAAAKAGFQIAPRTC